MNPRVVLVEDEPRLRNTLSRAVEQMGFGCEAFGSGEAALKAWPAVHDRPVIVVVDLNLPGMSGLELLAQIRERVEPNGAAFIVLTGFGDLAAAQYAIELDVVAFLTKPSPLGDFEAALDKAWRRLAIGPHEKRPAVGIPAIPDAASVTDPTVKQTLEEIERRHILDVVARQGGNRKAAAEELGISVRKLYYRLAEYGEE
ncbi:MAG: response regulator [Planctomycetota bacterium]